MGKRRRRTRDRTVEPHRDTMSDNKRKRFNRHKVAKEIDDGDKVNDRISKLPDDILCSILSLSTLTPRDVVRTSVLSSRWRHLWTSRPVLSFDDLGVLGIELSSEPFSTLNKNAQCDLLAERTSTFISSVHSFLQHHMGTGVEAFRVQFPMGNEYACHLDIWVCFAILSGTKELDLDLIPGWFGTTTEKQLPYDFPCHLFSAFGRGVAMASSLMRLCLNYCSLRPPPSIDGFDSLRVLKLCRVSMAEADLHLLLSRCHVLKSLQVVRCDQLVNMKISSPLENLYVGRCLGLKEIEFSTVNLVSFKYRGRSIDFIVNNAPQLVKASIFLECAPLTILPGLSGNLPQLNTLLLEIQKPIEDVILPSSSQKLTILKHLVVTLWIEPKDPLWVASLMNVAPLIEKLHFVQLLDFSHSDEVKETNNEMVKPPKCPHNYLKEVEISGFTGSRNQIQLAQYVLDNATILESLVIDPVHRHYRGYYKWMHSKPPPNDVMMRRRRAREHLSGEIPSGAKLVIL